MKKPASPLKTEKSAKRTPEEKATRKSAKSAGRASAELNDDRAGKKASQKKSLKSAAKQLQKELNSRMNEVVTRIRKETKAKLKEVVKEATRRLDGDTERMFEQALHTIVRHYDSVSGAAATDNSQSEAPTATPSAATGKSTGGRKKGPTLNKDGTPRKARASHTADEAATETTTPATSNQSRKPATKAKTTGTKRSSKPATASASTGAKRGPKPRVQTTPASEAIDAMNSTDSPGTGEVSE